MGAISKVSLKPFQRLAVSKGRAFGRGPQSAKHPSPPQTQERVNLIAEQSKRGNPNEGFPLETERHIQLLGTPSPSPCQETIPLESHFRTNDSMVRAEKKYFALFCVNMGADREIGVKEKEAWGIFSSSPQHRSQFPSIYPLGT